MAFQLKVDESVRKGIRRIARKEIHSTLLESMAREHHFTDGLISGSEQLLSLTGAAGAAVSFRPAEPAARTCFATRMESIGRWVIRRADASGRLELTAHGRELA